MPRRFLVLLTAAAFVVPIPGAGTTPRVVETWRATPQVAAVAVDDAGRIFIVDENTSGDLLLRAYRADGTLRWRRSWRPSGASLNANDVALGSDGSVVVAGQIDPDPPGDCSEIWSNGWAIAVWDPAGRPLWQRAQPGWRTCEATATSARHVASEGDVIALDVHTTDEYSSRARILAFDQEGHRLWRYEFEQPGSGEQWIDDVAVGAGGAVFVSGTFNVQTLDSPPTDQEAVLLKVDADGSKAWQRVVPDPLRGDDRGGGVTLTRGNVTAAALVREPGGPARIRVATYSRGGVFRWQRFVPRVVGSGWGDGFLATRLLGPMLATSQRDAEGWGIHVLLRAWDGEGSARWARFLGHRPDRSTVATGLAASRAAIVVVGRPPNQAGDWSRVWVLAG